MRVLLVEQDVGGLEVAVHDARLGELRLVQVLQPLRRLAHHLQPLQPGERRGRAAKAEPLQVQPVLAWG